MNFKTVHEASDEKDPEFEAGKDLYPRYSDTGLDEDFTIKKSPDLSLLYADIELVEVKKNPYSASYLSVYEVTIHLTKEAGGKMQAFSAKHLKRKVAIEVDGKIIWMPDMPYVISDEVVLIAAKTSVPEIEEVFRKVTDKIRISDVK